LDCARGWLGSAAGAASWEPEPPKKPPRAWPMDVPTTAPLYPHIYRQHTFLSPVIVATPSSLASVGMGDLRSRASHRAEQARTRALLRWGSRLVARCPRWWMRDCRCLAGLGRLLGHRGRGAGRGH